MKNLLLIILTLSLSSFTSNTNERTYEGVAKDKKSKQIIYKEVHEELFKEGKHIGTITWFVCKNNIEFAKRELDFSKSFQKPSYKLIDNRNGLIEEVTHKGGNHFDIRYRKNTNSKLKKKNIYVPEPAVVDGGFNYFIKNNWDRIISEEHINFNFLSAAFQNYFNFIIHRAKEKEKADNIIVLKMESKRTLLKLIMNPIYIAYDANTKRICHYEGISNIRDANGSSYKAILQYPKLGP
ncbi:hypothetical protein [Marinifilum sp.]|uniref:hypothetical protein n=1 Tax=Marinifilum sp. TaxID=2033137 RepID=UPI003BAA9938